MHMSQTPRRGYGQIAFGRFVFAGNLTLGFVDLLDDPLARLDVRSSGISEDHLPGTSLEKLRFEPCFQVGNLTADGRDRYSKKS